MASRKPLRIAITPGDPAGVGPEVTARALETLHSPEIIPVVVGRPAVMKRAAGPSFSRYRSLERNELADCFSGGPFLFPVETGYPLPEYGAGSEATGAESLACIDTAVDLWKEGLIDAMVTGPVHKGLIEQSGTPFSGHTEYIAARIGETHPLMMMFSPEYRVILATTHVPVARVAGLVDVDRLLFVIRKAHESLLAIDGVVPAIAVAGMDPHCGDGGSIGTFDAEVTEKAVWAARNESIHVEGPFAADTLFIPSRWKRYSVAVVHYHDQGLIPFKMAAFDTGVNVTLGLSIVRTSVDHGTAFDIAGRGIAQFTSMREAILLAARLRAGRETLG